MDINLLYEWYFVPIFYSCDMSFSDVSLVKNLEEFCKHFKQNFVFENKRLVS